MIVTNGASTERRYFEALKTQSWVLAGRVAVAWSNGSPAHIVKDAAKRRRESEFDQAWAVCDVDEFETTNAGGTARRLGVKLVWSNPCFEVWLILHKTECRTHLDSAKKACDRLAEITKGKKWSKSTLDFSEFENGIADAVRRAKRLGEPPKANPSTAVWRIVEALQDTGPAHADRTHNDKAAPEDHTSSS